MAGQAPQIGVKLTAQGTAEVVAAFKKVREQGTTAAHDTSESFKGLETQLESLKELLPALTAGFVVERAVEGIKEMVEQTVEAAVEIGHLSQQTGISTEQLSVMKYAAEQNGLSIEALSKGFKKLSTNLAEYTAGSKTAKATFDGLGIAQKDLAATGGDLWKVAELVADRFSKMEDGFKKNAAATALFGKAGQELIPLLNQGSAAFQEYAAQAQALGIVLDEAGVKKMEELHKASQQADAAMAGLGRTIIATLAPVILAATNQITKLIVKLKDLAGMGGNTTGGYQKYIPGDVFGLDPDQLESTRLSAANSRGAAKTDLAQLDQERAKGLVSLKEYNDKRLALTKDYNEANYRLQAAMFVQTQDQMASAQAALDKANKNKPSLWPGILDSDVSDAKQKIKGVEGAMHDVGERLKSAFEDKDKLPSPSADLTPKQTDEEKRKAAELQRQLDEARSRYLEAQAANELALAKAANAALEQEDNKRYAAGELSLDEYYDRRAARIKAAAATELAALEKQREGALTTKQRPVATAAGADVEEGRLRGLVSSGKAMPEDYKRLEAAEKAEAQAALVTANTKSQADQSELERTRAKHDLALQELADQKALQTAVGDKFGAEETGLQEELQRYGELLAKRKELTQAERDAMLAEFQDRGQAKIHFEETEQQYNAMLQDMQQRINSAQADASNGGITGLQASTQVLAIQRQQLPVLAGLANDMERYAEATHDDNLKTKAKADKVAIDELKKSADAAFNAQTYLFNQIETQGVQAGETFFMSWLSGSRSFKDSLADLAASFEQMIASMIAKMILLYTIELLVGWITGGDGDAIAGAAKLVTGHRRGGFTANVGEDQVAGVVHGKEWVATADQTRTYRKLFEAISAGHSPADFAPPLAPGARVSAAVGATAAPGGSGWPMTAAAPGAPPEVHVHNGTGQPTKTTQRTGSQGQSIVDIVVGIHKTALAKGTFDQQYRSQFGLNRAGVNRGGG